MNLIIATSIVILFVTTSCQENTKSVTYDQLIKRAEISFSASEYASALQYFLDATEKNDLSSYGYMGAGWCYFRMDSLTRARDQFLVGAEKDDANGDLYAGWAFILNAQQLYSLSNDKAYQTNSGWMFSLDSSLNSGHVHILKAQNHLLQGHYAEALAEVKTVDTNFNADISTDVGRAQLAMRIETLKALKSKPLNR